MRITKKIISVILAIMMIVSSLFSVAIVANAVGPVSTQTGFEDAVKGASEGATIILGEGNYSLAGVTIPNNVTIQGEDVTKVIFNCPGNGSICSVSGKVTFKDVTFNMGQNDYHGFQSGSVDMIGCVINGKFFSYGPMNFNDCTFNQSTGDYNMWIYGKGPVRYTHCTFNYQGKCLHVYNEGTVKVFDVVVDDCTFNTSVSNKPAVNVKNAGLTPGVTEPDKVTVVINDCEVNDDKGLILLEKQNDAKSAIAVGTDIKFDESGKIVSGDFSVLQLGENVESPISEESKIKPNDDGTYTVEEAVAAFSIGTESYETLADAVKAAQAGDVININVAGEYTLPNIPKNITINGAVDGVVFNCEGTGNICSVPNGAKFVNATFNFGQGGNYHGFQHAGYIVMENCNLNGLLFSYGDMTFNGCTFTQTAGEYVMWAYSGNLEYIGCKFDIKGKGVNVYNEGIDNIFYIKVEGCEFTSDTTNKSAFNVKETCGAKVLGYDVVIGDGNTTNDNFPTDKRGNNKLVMYDDVLNGESTSAKGIMVTVGGTKLYETPFANPVDEAKFEAKAAVRRAAGVHADAATEAIVNEAISNITSATDEDTILAVKKQAIKQIIPMPVCKIGDTDYYTLAEAVVAVPADGKEVTIVMTDDDNAGTISEGNCYINIVKGQNIVLDLAGYKVSGADNTNGAFSFINNSGVLTIKDSGGTGVIDYSALTNSAYNYATDTIYNNNGTLNIEGGTITCSPVNASTSYTIENSSNAWGAPITSVLNISGGVVTCGAKADSTIRVYQNSISTDEHNIVNISGGKVEGYFNFTSNYNGENSVVDINITGGEMENIFFKHANGVPGVGEYDINISGDAVVTGQIMRSAANATPEAFAINISGGTFTNPALISSGGEFVKVTGGNFKFDVNEYCVDGYVATANPDGSYGVQSAYEAKIGTVLYDTLAAAVTAAKAGDEVVLLSDVDTGNGLSISKAITLNLNGHTVIGLGVKNDSAPLQISNNAVIVKNGTIKNRDNGTSSVLVGLTSQAKFIDVFFDATNGCLNCVRGGTPTFIGACRFEGTSATRCTYNGGYFKADGDKAPVANAGYISYYAPAYVEAGIYTLSAAKNQLYYKATSDTSITGGEFSKDPSNYLASGYVADPFEKDNATWYKVITEEEAMAKYFAFVDGKGYYTVADAIAAAGDGSVITVAKSLSEEVIIATNKKLTIDLNGATLTGLITASNANVTITDSSIDGNGVFDGTITGTGVSVTGGKFTNNPSDFVKAPYEVIEDDGLWKVVLNRVEGCVYFEDELLAAIALGGEIKLGCDIDFSTKLDVRKPTILDLNGFTLSTTGVGSGANIIEANNTSFTIKNGTLRHIGTEGTALLRATSASGNITVDCTVISGITAVRTGSAGSVATVKGNAHIVTASNVDSLYAYYGTINVEADENGNVPVIEGKLNIKPEQAVFNFTAGTFFENPNAYLGEQYATNMVDGKYSVVYTSAYIPETTTYYSTLTEALQALQEGQTLVLCEDFEDCGSIMLPANVTLDGDGHKISGDASVYINKNGGTVKNVVFTDIHGSTFTRSAIYAQGLNGKATVQGCTFDTFDWDAVQLLPNAGAEVVVTDNTFKFTGSSETSHRYVHIQSAKNTDFKATVTNNDFFNTDKLSMSALEAYYFTDIEDVDFNMNYFDAPAKICVLSGNGTDASDVVKNMKATAGDCDEAVEIVATLDVNGDSRIFTSLQDAIDAADATNYQVKLLKDVVLTGGPVTVTKKLTLDLAGHKITEGTGYANPYALVVVERGGDLTVTGNGTVESTKAYAAIQMISAATAAGGELAKLTVKNGTFIGYYYAIVGNGNRHGTEINIEDGVFTFSENNNLNDSNAIYHPQYGDLNISGGEFIGYNSAIELRSGNLDITGGDFVATAPDYSQSGNGNGTTIVGAAIAISQHTTAKPISVKISDGKFTGAYAFSEAYVENGTASDVEIVSISGGEFNGTVKSVDCKKFISGGKFSEPVELDYTAQNYHPVKDENGKYTVAEGEAVAVIEVDDEKVYFTSLSEAVAAVPENGTVTVLQDVVLTGGPVTVTKKLTLDLAGHKITEGTGYANPYALVVVERGGDLTVTGNGTVESTKAYAAIQMISAATASGDELAKLTVKNGTFIGYYYAIVGNGNRHGTEINIEDGVFTFSENNNLNDSNAIYHPQYGDLNISGGKFTGYNSAIELRSGNLDITGGDFVATAPNYSQSGNGNGTTIVGAAIAISQHTTAKPISVKISDGKFTGAYAFSEAYVENGTASDVEIVSISGGEFNGTVKSVDCKKFISGGKFSVAPEQDAVVIGKTPKADEDEYFFIGDCDHENEEFDENGNGLICGAKIAAIVTAKSVGAVASVSVTGEGVGNAYASGTVLTLTAPALSGYDFDGWYIGNVKISGDKTCNYTVIGANDVAIEARYAVAQVFNFVVNASKFKLNGKTQRGYLNTKSKSGVYTLEYVGNDSEVFMYWINSSKKIVGNGSTTVEVVLNSDANYTAVTYDPTAKDDDSIYVVFESAFGQVLSAGYYTAEDEIAFPSAPLNYGRTFSNWSHTEGAIKDLIGTKSYVRVVPNYVSSTERYTLTVDSVIDGVVVDSISKDTLLGNTTIIRDLATEIDGNKLLYIVDENGDIYSYTNAVAVASFEDMHLYAVYGSDPVEAKAVTKFTDTVKSGNDAKASITFVTSYAGLPEDCRVLRYGIVRTSEAELANESNLVLENVDGTKIKLKEGNDPDTVGTYALSISLTSAASRDKVFYARSFVTYETSEGIFTVYSDDIVAVSYNEVNM